MRARIFRVIAVVIGMILIAHSTRAEETGRKLFLELWINERPSHLIVAIVERGTAFLAQVGDLDEAGIRIDENERGDGLVDLARLADVQYRIDQEGQRLFLDIGAPRQMPHVFTLRESLNDVKDEQDSAALSPQIHMPLASASLNYDVFARANDVSAVAQNYQLGVSSQLALTTPSGTLTSTAFAVADRGDHNAVRLDTAFRIDEPYKSRSWSIGDAISGGQAWSRSVRYAGFQLSRDFAMRPDLATFPLPDFFGRTDVPTTVDVYVGASRVFEQDVDAGPFEIRNVPVLTGRGDVTVYTRDALGRETSYAIPLYSSQRLLEKGLLDYTLDIGALRRSYGVRSFDYATLAGSFSLRYGLNDTVTLEGLGEVSPRNALAGGGAAIAVQPFGVFGVSSAVSQGPDGIGVLNALSIETQRDPFSLFCSWSRASPHFADLAARDGTPPAARRLQLGASTRIGRRGSLSASWIAVQPRDEGRISIANASYTLSFGDGRVIGLSGLHDVSNEAWTLAFFLSVPFGTKARASAEARLSDGRNSSRGTYEHPADLDGGFGYRLIAEDTGGTLGRAEGEWRHGAGRISAALAHASDTTGAQMSAEGAFVAIGDDVFASQVRDGAYALVDVGRKDVRVYRENREMTRSDKGGKALLTGLVPFSTNHISVNERDYPMTTILSGTEHVLISGRYSAGIIDLAPDPGSPLLITVKLPENRFPDAGTPVQIDGMSHFLIVGRHGKVFLPDAGHATQGRILLDGGACRFDIVPESLAQDERIVEPRPVTCAMEKSGAR